LRQGEENREKGEKVKGSGNRKAGKVKKRCNYERPTSTVEWRLRSGQKKAQEGKILREIELYM
jgi:stalled ribosome alternative rescue factor ArfA